VILLPTRLRSGELLALQWDDLKFTKNEIRIQRALHYARRGLPVPVSSSVR
jgi:integrase